MKRRTVMLSTVGALIIGPPSAFLLMGVIPGLNRTLIGRVSRSMIWGTPIARQCIIDLADDARDPKLAGDLRAWASAMRAKYDAGAFPRDAAPDLWPQPSVQIPDSELPDWLTHRWQDGWFGRGPAAWICLSEVGKPGFVNFGWYLCGIAVGPAPKEQLEIAWDSTEATPGIFTYAVEK